MKKQALFIILLGGAATGMTVLEGSLVRNIHQRLPFGSAIRLLGI